MTNRKFFQNKRVLVTGAGGFIGSHLVEALLDLSAEVRAFVHYNSRNSWGFLEELPSKAKANINVISADLRDYHATEKATRHVDIVFHLGALIGIPYSITFPNDVVETNVIGTLNILKASLKSNVQKIIHTSTSEVYGTAKYTPIDENHPLNPQSPYAASKVAADKLSESFYQSYGLPISILRPFNTFGPRQSLRAIIPTIITQLLRNHKIIVGNLKPIRDFTYVSDTVRGFIMLAKKMDVDGNTFNLGTGREINIKELINLISELIGTVPEIEVDEQRIRSKQSEVMRLVSDNSKAKKEIGWQPKTTFRDGLNLTINWLNEKKLFGKFQLYNI